MSVGGVVEYKGKRGTTYRLRFRDAKGVRQGETLPLGTSKREAHRLLAERVADVSRGVHRKKDDKTLFCTYAEAWLPTYAETENLRKSTRDSYKVLVKILCRAFPVKLAAVDAPTIRKAMATWAKDGASGATVNRRLAVLQLILRTAVEEGLIPVNPARDVRRAKEDRQVERPLKPNEVQRIAAAFDSIIAGEKDQDKRDDAISSRMLFLLACETGARKGELLGLRWENVALADPDGAHVRIAEARVNGETGEPKTKAGRRKIMLSPQISEALFQHRAWSSYDGDGDLVVPNPRKGSAFDCMVYSVLFKRALRIADIPDAEKFRPLHGLRRTSITNGAASGMDVHALQTRAGHSNPIQTAAYTDLAEELFPEESQKVHERMWGEA
jgi:integrase